jgi:choline dehydrogenase-like flavoprotein
MKPFTGKVAGALGGRSIGLSHPLGGCRMATSAADGVCDEYGRVYDKSKDGGTGFYDGLYITDAARIPTALGVNPSLTITALALYSADHIVAGLPATQAPAPAPVPTSSP